MSVRLPLYVAVLATMSTAAFKATCAAMLWSRASILIVVQSVIMISIGVHLG